MKEKLKTYREDVEKYHQVWYKAAVSLAEKIGVVPSVPGKRSCRGIVTSSDPETYYRQRLTIPLLGEKNSDAVRLHVKLN